MLENLLRPKRRWLFRLKRPVYFNRHPGKDFLILATGPNLKNYAHDIQEFIDKYNPVTIGCNFLGGLFVPQYHAFTNRKQFCMFASNISPQSIPILSVYFNKWIIKKCIGDRYFEWLQYKYTKGNNIPLKIYPNGVINTCEATIATNAIALAISMGAKNVYAVGMDGFSMYPTIDDIHFYVSVDRQPMERRLYLEERGWDILRIAQDMLQQRGGSLHILTPTVYKPFYKLMKELYGIN